MTIAEADNSSDKSKAREFRGVARLLPHEDCLRVPEGNPRIALLTPYNGGNLGDAAIQDALIANFRLRLPGARFSGISLNGDNFVERHGTGSFPLCGSDDPFYRMYRGRIEDQAEKDESRARLSGKGGRSSTLLKGVLTRAPALLRWLKTLRALGTRVYRELLHCVGGYRFLRNHDLLVVSGGGQLDEEWGGPWGHPFTLFKWAVMARIARVPYAIASVGACKINSTTSRLFLSAALRMAQYRSYRDKRSREVAAHLLQRAASDTIVPDLAFTLPPFELPLPAGIKSISQGRSIVAISPIAFARPESWPSPNRALHEQYMQQMTEVVSQLLNRGYFLVIVCSSLGDDERVIPDLLERLDNEAKERVARQIYIPKITTWKDLASCLWDVDFLISSRLHSAILGFLTQTPTVTISFDPKVDSVMEDLNQTEYLLHIADFTAKEVMEAFDRIERRSTLVQQQIATYMDQIRSVCALQYDAVAGLVMTHRRRTT
jgi:polysaccharide pyruvyl transferase WcaK-like protein